MQSKNTSTRTCSSCRVSIPAQSKYCQHCGHDVLLSDAVRSSHAGRTHPIPSRSRINTSIVIVLIVIFICGVSVGASAWFSHPRQVPSPLIVVPSQQPLGMSNAPVDAGVQPAESGSSTLSAQVSEVGVNASPPSGHRPVICIDPGHPSEVGRGTQGRYITEIQAAWEVALRLRSLLEQQGWKVVMTKKTEEQFVRNEERANIANRNHAVLMVRLHCDADAGSGIATYVPTQQGRNNGKTGPDWSVIEKSKRIASIFHAAMTRSLGHSLQDRGLHSDTATQVGGKQGALTGSIYSHVPVLLVEMCVLTNPRDEAFIDNDQGQQRMAQAMAKGVNAALQARAK